MRSLIVIISVALFAKRLISPPLVILTDRFTLTKVNDFPKYYVKKQTVAELVKDILWNSIVVL